MRMIDRSRKSRRLLPARNVPETGRPQADRGANAHGVMGMRAAGDSGDRSGDPPSASDEEAPELRSRRICARAWRSRVRALARGSGCAMAWELLPARVRAPNIPSTAPTSNPNAMRPRCTNIRCARVRPSASSTDSGEDEGAEAASCVGTAGAVVTCAAWACAAFSRRLSQLRAKASNMPPGNCSR